MDPWKKLYTTRSQAEASIIQGVLEENQIPVQTMNKQDSSYLIGDIEVYVPDHFIETAKQLLERSLLN